MIFESTTIENFFSIAKRVVWDMNDQGLVLISGDNGAGKSTLFEALVWCLWGKTVRGQTGDAVVNRHVGKNCSVLVEITHDDHRYGIGRYRKHKKNGNTLHFFRYTDEGTEDLTQGTVAATQTRINAFLGIDYLTFIQGPMLPQGSFRKFSEMTDSEQKAVLEEVLQISVLAAALAETKERLAVATPKLKSAEEDLRRQWLDYETLTDECHRYESERDSWSRTQKQAVAKITQELLEEVLEQEHFWENSRIVNFDAAIEEAREKADEIRDAQQERHTEGNAEAAEFQKKVSVATADHRSAQNRAYELQSLLTSINKLKEGTCPTCHQHIEADHIDRVSDKIEKDIVVADKAVSLAAESLRASREKLSQYTKVHRDILAGFETNLKTTEEKILTLVTEAGEAKQWVEAMSASHRREAAIRLRLRQKQQEKSPFEDLIQNTKCKIRGQLALISKTRAKVRSLRIEVDHLEFWKAGFSNKGLKSHILKSVIPYLNERASRYAQILTGGELKIEFDTQTALKGGGTRERFSVMVTNKNGADTYAGNSGGEKSRADLAVNLTLSDLTSERAHRSFTQRFLDEPFESLDESGIEAVMELLSTMAQNKGSIFVITHQDAMKGLFGKTITMTKSGGSASCYQAKS